MICDSFFSFFAGFGLISFISIAILANFAFRYGNLYSTRRYPAQPNPNGLDLTWLDKL